MLNDLLGKMDTKKIFSKKGSTSNESKTKEDTCNVSAKAGGSNKLKELTRNNKSTASLMNAVMDFLLKNKNATGTQVLKNIFKNYWNEHYGTVTKNKKEVVSFKTESATDFKPNDWSKTLDKDGHNSVTNANSLQEQFSKNIKPYGNGEDGYGSDSDYEGEKINGYKIYGRKFVVPTGMRAIVVSSCASAKQRGKYSNVNWDNMYYEAEDLFKNSTRLKNISFLPKQIYNEKSKYKLILQDVNQCINSIKYESTNQVVDEKETDIIYDVTSSTQSEMGEIVAKALCKNNKDYVMLVSSGLKNESMGLDNCHYGLIRIFSKNKDTVKKLYDSMNQHAHTKVSGFIHQYRRALKNNCDTPTIKGIIVAAEKHKKQ